MRGKCANFIATRCGRLYAGLPAVAVAAKAGAVEDITLSIQRIVIYRRILDQNIGLPQSLPPTVLGPNRNRTVTSIALVLGLRFREPLLHLAELRDRARKIGSFRISPKKILADAQYRYGAAFRLSSVAGAIWWGIATRFLHGQRHIDRMRISRKTESNQCFCQVRGTCQHLVRVQLARASKLACQDTSISEVATADDHTHRAFPVCGQGEGMMRDANDVRTNCDCDKTANSAVRYYARTAQLGAMGLTNDAAKLAAKLQGGFSFGIYNLRGTHGGTGRTKR